MNCFLLGGIPIKILTLWGFRNGLNRIGVLRILMLFFGLCCVAVGVVVVIIFREGVTKEKYESFI